MIFADEILSCPYNNGHNLMFVTDFGIVGLVWESTDRVVRDFTGVSKKQLLKEMKRKCSHTLLPHEQRRKASRACA